MKPSEAKLVTIGVTALATAFLTIFLKNFISGEKKIRRRIPRIYGSASPQFERSMSQLLGPPIVTGNRVTRLENGAEIFPAMIAAIGKAQTTITFETFIFCSGEIADRFSHALAAKAREGVKVHVLIDGFGCNCVGGEALRRMTDAGVELEVYHIQNIARANQRTHRKLLVIDGRLGFIGGVGIADEWLGNAGSPDHWRDTHYQLEGPAVAQLQAAFLDNWMKTRATVLHGDAYFPPLDEVGPHHCQVFKSSPMEGSESARLMFLMCISAAEKNLRIGNAYFVPDDLTTETIIAAARRGVEVEVLVPGPHLDSYLVRGASRHRWGNLLKEGVRIFEYKPTMYHCKCMIIDDLWTSIGSANFDNRSFRLNDEANLNVIDHEFAAEAIRIFQEDQQQANEISYQDWHQRPLVEKIADASATVFRSQL